MGTGKGIPGVCPLQRGGCKRGRWRRRGRGRRRQGTVERGIVCGRGRRVARGRARGRVAHVTARAAARPLARHAASSSRRRPPPAPNVAAPEKQRKFLNT